MKEYGNTDFYKQLKKPPYQAPAWLFRPMWMVLYALLFISLTLVIIAPQNPLKIYAYIAFSIQLLLNFSWMPTFFRERKLCQAFIISALLFISICVMMYFYYKISIIAAILLIPYLLWSLYAAAINFYICEVN